MTVAAFEGDEIVDRALAETHESITSGNIYWEDFLVGILVVASAEFFNIWRGFRAVLYIKPDLR